MQEIRLAVVGYGRGGGLFQLAVNGFEGVTPAAVCDLNPQVLDRARKAHPGVCVFSDFDEMLEAVPMDALLVATPATCHADLAVKALARNVHVMSEIPCVNSLAEAQRLWSAHLASRALYMTGANPNLWAFVEAAVDLKKKGLLGEPVYMEAEYIHDCRSLFSLTPWRETYEPIKYCTHSLGPLLRLIDEDLEWVSCFDTGSHINRKTGQHDVMTALFRTRSNVVVRLLTSFINNYASEGHHYRIFTTKGCYERVPATGKNLPQRTLFYSTELCGTRDWIQLPAEFVLPEYIGNPKAEGHGGADYALLDRFFKAIRGGLPSPISLREGLRMTLPGTYAAESARRGGELVRIEYPWQTGG